MLRYAPLLLVLACGPDDTADVNDTADTDTQVDDTDTDTQVDDTDTDTQVDDTDTGPIDADGDGYPADQDCDDSDASIHPGVTDDDPYDGVDSDCDGTAEPSPLYACPTCTKAAASGGWTENYLAFERITLQAGTVTHLGIVDGPHAGGGIGTLALYADDWSKPGTLVAYTNTYDDVQGTHVLEVIDEATVAAGTYWFATVSSKIVRPLVHETAQNDTWYAPWDFYTSPPATVPGLTLQGPLPARAVMVLGR